MKSEAEIKVFTKLTVQLNELLGDFAELSKKKPNEQVNKFKLKLVNKLLDTANSIIDDRNRPFDDFEKFDEVDLPSNSDVVLILTQYSGCLKSFRSENIDREGIHRYWIIKGKRSKILAE